MAVPRRARRLWGYWRAEQRTLRQGSVALLLSTAAAFVAGLTLSSIEETLRDLPGLLILIPAANGIRGTISGATAARLGTSIHVGLFDVTRDRTGVLYQNLYVGIVMTLISSLYLAVLTKLAGAAFGVSTISIAKLVTISVVGGVLSSAIILVVTVGLAVLSFRRGYDLDAVATPMVTAIGDMVTLPTLFLATLLVENDVVNGIVAGACVLAGVVALVRASTTDLVLAKRILLELIGVALLTPILDIIAGVLLQSQLEPGRLFSIYPGLLILVPPFVSQAGAIGGILASRLSSKLQLGVITPRGRPEVPAVIDASIVGGFGALVFTLIGLATVAVVEVTQRASTEVGAAIPGAATTIGATLLAGLLATIVVIVLAYYVGVGTARFGLDPDNHSVPIITGTMDLAGVACILVAMSLLGVATHG